MIYLNTSPTVRLLPVPIVIGAHGKGYQAVYHLLLPHSAQVDRPTLSSIPDYRLEVDALNH